jgi:hypothetical protein
MLKLLFRIAASSFPHTLKKLVIPKLIHRWANFYSTGHMVDELRDLQIIITNTFFDSFLSLTDTSAMYEKKKMLREIILQKESQPRFGGGKRIRHIFNTLQSVLNKILSLF